MIRPTKQKHETDARRSSPNRREIKKRKNKRNRREKSEPEARHETEERQKTKSMKTRQTAGAKLGTLAIRESPNQDPCARRPSVSKAAHPPIRTRVGLSKVSTRKNPETVSRPVQIRSGL